MPGKIMATLAVLISVGGGAGVSRAQQAVQLKRLRNHIDILVGGKIFTTYHFDPEVAKPYFQPLRSARGTIVTRDFPNGNVVPAEHRKDPDLEPHQRPMYLGHGNIDGIDFWGEAAFPNWSDDGVFGRTVLSRIETMTGGTAAGTLRADFDLVGPRGRVIGEEVQAYTFRGDENTRVIDCTFFIQANRHAAVTMGDTKEGTFAIRLAKALNSPPARMINSNGSVGEKEIWGKRADWVDYDGTVDGESLGVAVFDSPRSFRHPTYWHARGYGLLAANPFGIREFTGDPNQDGSWTIPERQSLRLEYRVFIHHGDCREAKVADAYRQYVAETK
jgi:hypothetical protein